MNRIIIIGNGFDKAHGLPTDYTDFMDSYWKKFVGKTNISEPYEDDLIKFEEIGKGLIADNNWEIILNQYLAENNITAFDNKQASSEADSYCKIEQYIAIHNGKEPNYDLRLIFKNDFWKHISTRAYLSTWLDIENEYYDLLKSYLKVENKNELVKKLNDEFCKVKNLLEKYLTEVCQKTVTKEDSIEKALKSAIKLDDVAISKKQVFINSIPTEIRRMNSLLRNSSTEYNFASINEPQLNYQIKENIEKIGIPTLRTLFLNFNYTNTAQKLYAKPDDVIINIHGELNSKSNPIIFGYGDELDDDYREIEKTNDKDFLDNIKSIHYNSTKNYRRLLEFLQYGAYQIFTMGHSCGNSDRTLLNTIFEHPNCISVKPFFYQWGNGDDYTDIFKNISRNFPNKQNMRDIVVNKEYCEPLIPIKS